MHANPDGTSPYCLPLVQYWRWFFPFEGYTSNFDVRDPRTGLKTPKSAFVYFTLPLTPAKRARNDATKAYRRGYVIMPVARTRGMLEQWRGIIASSDQRQGRSVMTVMNRYDGSLWDSDSAVAWPVADYRDFTCEQHNLRAHVVFDLGGDPLAPSRGFGAKAKGIVAVAESARIGDTALVTVLMGHADHLRHGIVNALLLRVAEDRAAEGCRFLSYGCVAQLNTRMGTFLGGLGEPLDGSGARLADVD